MLMSVAVTGMVVLAFIVPLSSLVGDLANDTAISAAERDAESLARVLSVLAIDHPLKEAVEIFGEDRIRLLSGSVIGPDNQVFGQAVPAGEDLSPAREGSERRGRSPQRAGRARSGARGQPHPWNLPVR